MHSLCSHHQNKCPYWYISLIQYFIDLCSFIPFKASVAIASLELYVAFPYVTSEPSNVSHPYVFHLLHRMRYTLYYTLRVFFNLLSVLLLPTTETDVENVYIVHKVQLQAHTDGNSR